jgi:hypothetical protein
MRNKIIHDYPDTDYSLLTFKAGNNRALEISGKDKDGDVLFESIDDYDKVCVYLDQEEIKILIEFLQKQIKP